MKLLVGYKEAEDEFWSWVAGFWEGEGNISLWINEHGQSKVWLGIAQKDPSPLYHILNTAGVGRVWHQTTGRKYDIWRYDLAVRRDLLWFLENIEPHLRFRRKKVVDAISLLERLDKEARWHPWRNGELDYLRDNFHSGSHAELMTILGRNWKSIKSKAQKMGLRRR